MENLEPQSQGSAGEQKDCINARCAGEERYILQAASTLRSWAKNRQVNSGSKWTPQEQAAVECAARLENSASPVAAPLLSEEETEMDLAAFEAWQQKRWTGGLGSGSKLTAKTAWMAAIKYAAHKAGGEVTAESVHDRTCIHHTDDERAAARMFDIGKGCPVCRMSDQILGEVLELPEAVEDRVETTGQKALKAWLQARTKLIDDFRKTFRTRITRSTEDACKGILWQDDGQVVKQTIEKAFSDQPGCWIIVREVQNKS